MEVRQEEFDDRAGVYAVVHAAFASGDQTIEPPEVGLLQKLFTCQDYDPQFSLVALDENVVIGHVIASWGTLDGKHRLLGLGPLAVAPEYQQRGVGSILMQAIHDRAKERELPGIVLLGHIDYYRRFGYEPASAHGITPSDQGWGEHFMVKVLNAQTLPTGAYRYSEPFGC
ncbi:GNAT family N-acetyltransferase [Glutamicibacter uratoxydans]|uniref:GNAT family N-acetyltransferase n=1 Tax=Glutamicibacter uratoxydans TaxID=43667 RepID=UPI003D6F4661